MSASVCLPLGQILGTFFVDLDFRGAPSGNIQGTWILKITTLFAGRWVCVSAFVCLPLGQIFDKFFIDLGFRGAPWGHIKGTWTLKMITLVPHLAGAGPRDTFLMNLGCILGAISDTILHTDGHF